MKKDHYIRVLMPQYRNIRITAQKCLILPTVDGENPYKIYDVLEIVECLQDLDDEGNYAGWSTTSNKVLAVVTHVIEKMVGLDENFVLISFQLI